MKHKKTSQYLVSDQTQTLDKTPNTNKTGIAATPTHDELAKLAYVIYLNQGSSHGRDVAHWLEAEAQVTVSANEMMNA